MENEILKFCYEIFNDVLVRCKLNPIPLVSTAEESLTNVPVLYNQRCKNMVNYYFTHYKESIPKYYLKECVNFNDDTFINIANKLIHVSSRHHQCSEVFYRLCIQLAVLSAIALKEGYDTGVYLGVNKILPLASEAYHRCDLDVRYECMFNYSFDVLSAVFNWYKRANIFNNKLSRLVIDFDAVNYFDLYKSHFEIFLENKGELMLGSFNGLGSNLRIMTREGFIFQIQDWCDEFYRKLDPMRIVQLHTTFLDISMYISLLTLHAWEILHPCDLRLAHETILRLAILAARNGIIHCITHKQIAKQKL